MAQTKSLSLLKRGEALFRASGADLPFGDPLTAHGVGMEGYFWRVTDRDRGRALIALIGVNDDGERIRVGSSGPERWRVASPTRCAWEQTLVTAASPVSPVESLSTLVPKRSWI